MTCMRCGSAEAVIKRENAFYCAKCVLARDWEEVIALVQRERVDVPGVQMGRTNPSAATATIEMDHASPSPAAPAEAAPPPEPAAAPAFLAESDPFAG
jgi:hypothetical protein